MSSEVDICNRALSRLGQAQIVNLTDGTVEARACNLHYLPERDGFLEEHDWHFGITREVLAEVTNTREAEYDHAYQRPAGAHTVIGVFRSDLGPIDPPDPYRLEGDTIFCNIPIAHIIYAGATTNPGKWSELFRTALSWRIQAAITMALTEDERREAKAQQQAEYASSRAQAHDIRQRAEFQTYTRVSPTIIARLGLEHPGRWYNRTAP